MPTTTFDASQIIGKTLKAIGNVPYYYPIGTKIGTFTNGETIGVVYSYAYGGTNDLYWMITTNTGYIFVKHDINDLELVGGKELLDDIEKQKDQALYDSEGPLKYYLDKYGSVIVGVIAIGLGYHYSQSNKRK